MKCEDARELITALTDGELGLEERSSVEAHLNDCPRCRWAYNQERALKKDIHAIASSIHAPADLKRKILARRGRLPIESEPLRGWSKLAASFRPLRPAFAFVVFMLVLVSAIILFRPTKPSISLAALEIQQKIAQGEIPLRKATNEAELRDWQIRAVGGKFAPMEYDLSSMHLRPTGGAVQEINGRKMLVTVYSGNDISVTCFTFLGSDEDVPKNAAAFPDAAKKLTFYAFSGDGLNAVFHREGNVICILISKMRPEELLAIASGKVGVS